MEHIDSEEFAELIAFEAKEPDQWEKLYFYIAQMTCYLVNVQTDKGKKLEVEDLMIPFAEKAWEEEDDEGWKAIRNSLRQSLGGKVKGRKRKWQQRLQER